jgi:hypothetical protein
MIMPFATYLFSENIIKMVMPFPSPLVAQKWNITTDRIWGYPYYAHMTQGPQLGSFVLKLSNVTTTNKNIREFIKSTGN